MKLNVIRKANVYTTRSLYHQRDLSHGVKELMMRLVITEKNVIKG